MPGYTKCLVTRDRNGVKNRLYPTYQLFVQDGAPGTSPGNREIGSFYLGFQTFSTFDQVVLLGIKRLSL